MASRGEMSVTVKTSALFRSDLPPNEGLASPWFPRVSLLYDYVSS
jgi:hypothetical protein